jgi:hypothetical protein
MQPTYLPVGLESRSSILDPRSSILPPQFSLPAPLSNGALIFLFVIALAPRLALLSYGPWSQPGRALQPDSFRYLQLAENLREFHTFGLRQEEGLVHQSLASLRVANGTLPPADGNGLRPESFRTPGYPFLIALIQELAGGIRTILVMQCLLGSMMACMVASVARTVGLPIRGAVLAGVIWALHPGLIVYDCVVLTESLFNAVAITALLLAGRFRSPFGLALAGAALGLVTLVRPLGLFYLPAALALAWPGLRWRWLAVPALILAAGIPPCLWARRNEALGEGFRVTSVADLNLLYYTAAYSISEERGEDWRQSWPTRVNELTLKLKSRIAPGQDVMKTARDLALEELAARPTVVAKVEAKSLVKLALDHSAGTAADVLGLSYQPTGLFSRLVLRQAASGEGGGKSANQGIGETGKVMVAGAFAWSSFNLVLSLAALAGLFGAFRRFSWRLLVAGGLTLLFFVVATGSVGLERFRLPMMLPIVLLAGSLVNDRRNSLPPALKVISE